MVLNRLAIYELSKSFRGLDVVNGSSLKKGLNEVSLVDYDPTKPDPHGLMLVCRPKHFFF